MELDKDERLDTFEIYVSCERDLIAFNVEHMYMKHWRD